MLLIVDGLEPKVSIFLFSASKKTSFNLKQNTYISIYEIK